MKAYAMMLCSILIGTFFSPIFKTILKLNAGLTSTNITFFRMVLTSLILWAYCLFVPELRRQTAAAFKDKKTLILIITLGLSRGLDLLCWAYALDGTTTFILSILGNSTPVFVVAASYFLYGEKTKPLALLGVGICLAGLGIVGISSSRGGSASLRAIVLMICSACLYTGFLLISRKLRTGETQISALLMMTIVFTLCIPTALVPCVVSGASMGPFTLKAWLLLLALVLCSTLIGQIVPIWAIRYLNPTSISMVSLCGPIFTAINCYFLLGEVPGISVLSGGAIVLFGLYLYTLGSERLARKESEN